MANWPIHEDQEVSFPKAELILSYLHSMEQRQFGNHDFLVSRIGLGLAALGRPGYINLGHAQDLDADYDVHAMESRTHAVLDEAIAAGISYFDVAQSYGRGEEFLSSWLGDREVIVGSKWGYYYTADWQVEAQKHEIKEHSISLLNKQWPESRDRLSPQLRIYHIHSATFESGVLENLDVLEKLEAIRAEGFVIGLSLSGLQQAAVLEKALKIKIGEEPLFGSVQATYNILETSVGAALAKAHDQGVGVIIKEVVANGRLTNRNERAPYYGKLRGLAEKYEVGTDAVATAFVLSKPFTTIALSGAATANQMRANVQAMGLSLENEDLKALEALTMAPESYWAERTGMSWN